jgi:hypothetical protein
VEDDAVEAVEGDAVADDAVFAICAGRRVSTLSAPLLVSRSGESMAKTSFEADKAHSLKLAEGI